jgi:adenylosuccinate lyase
MPHKRNPISAETISGLSRVLRGNLQAGMQDIALWHERDISHSSVERIVLPDSSTLAHYVLRRGAGLLKRLDVDADAMRTNLESGRGLIFSQPVLLALVAAGLGRDEAYRVVQGAALWAADHKEDFRAVLSKDPAVAGLPESTLDDAFDLPRSLRHTSIVFDALDGVAP